MENRNKELKLGSMHFNSAGTGNYSMYLRMKLREVFENFGVHFDLHSFLTNIHLAVCHTFLHL